MLPCKKVCSLPILCFIILNVYCAPIDKDNINNKVEVEVQEVDTEEPKLPYETHIREDGYDFNIETDDGYLKNENATISKDGILNIVGDYSFKFPNGQFEFYEYKAGVNGVISKVTFGNPGTTGKKILTAAINSLAGGGLG